MQHKFYLVIAFVIIAFILNIITVSSKIGLAVSDKTTVNDLDLQVEGQDTNKLIWVNETGRIQTRDKLKTSKGETVYKVTVKLPQIDDHVVLNISELEYKILQDEDEVKVHYIVDEVDKAVAYAQFIRDEMGRLDIVKNKPWIVLDAGHGGYELGEGSNNLWVEKELNLKMTMKLKEYLEEAGMRVVLTRSEDAYVSLYDRCELSNYVQADLFISNHLNKLNGKVSGVEVIYSMKSDNTLANDLADAVALSGLEVLRVYNKRSEKFPNRDYYFVHKYNNVDSYIIEYGFSDNEEDTKIINENWDTMVKDVAEVIIDYSFQ